MKYIFISILILCSTKIFSQSKSFIENTKEFISKTIYVEESNPIHKKESTEINSIFKNQLNDFPTCKLDTCRVAKLLIDNSITLYEEVGDAYRYSFRRCLIYSILSLSLDSEKSDLYLTMAEKSLYNLQNKIEPNQIDNYAGILILKLLIKGTNETLTSVDVNMIKTKFENTRNSLSKPLYEKGLQIIKEYDLKIRVK
jgi:hypothetical protein